MSRLHVLAHNKTIIEKHLKNDKGILKVMVF